MKNIELQIKPALLLLLRDKFIEDVKRFYSDNVIWHTSDEDFYKWLLREKLISQMEYERLIKEE